MLKTIIYPAFGLLLGWLALERAALAGCTDLLSQKLPDTEITKAEPVARGAFAVAELPAFCHVVGIIRPTADSIIGFELWLPERWNERYLQVGNGGFAGMYFYGGLIQGMQNGFAVAGTDDGHLGKDTGWMSHPEKVIDYGSRAVHLTSITAKLIIEAYYHRHAPYAYFSGCSDGGRESLMEAQRYPDDFDGWIVGAPANNWTDLMVHHLHSAQVRDTLKAPLTSAQLKAVAAAAITRCDADDGLADGLIENPLHCAFDPGELLCKDLADGRCLSQAQVQLMRDILDDLRAPVTHASLVRGFQGAVGVESTGWQFSQLVTGNTDPFSREILNGFWPRMVYGKPTLDYRRLDLLQAFKDGRSRVGSVVNAVDPDLSAIRASGKKIIQYHGWADPEIPAQYSIAYYEAVERYLGADNRDFYRLFMVPGMSHCSGGPGPNIFGGAYTAGGEFDPDYHALAALMQWVEKSRAPERIIATKYEDDNPAKAVIRTRPLCVYPKVARWTGKRNVNEAENFSCD